MAVQGRINVRHEDVFPQPVLLLSVSPVENFDMAKAARAAGRKDADTQERDKDTNQRRWAASIMDPTAPEGRREIKVKIPAEVQPVPPSGVMPPVEFDGLQVIPYVDTNRQRPRLGIAYRATGFRGAPRKSA